MKKAINILLTAFLAVTLAGCSSSSDPTPAPTSGTSEKETAEPEPTPEPSAPAQASSTYEVYKLGDTINTYGDITFTLTEVGVSETISREPDDTFLLPSEDGFKSGDAYRYLYYKIDFKYTGNKPAKQYDLFYMLG